MSEKIRTQVYRCPKCSKEHFVLGVLSRHILEKHPELAELIIGDAIDSHIMLGQWGE